MADYARNLITFISIHAPTRGATSVEIALSTSKDISIHAPTRGATFDNITVYCYVGNFNPRSHKGSDIMTVNIQIAPSISIHAPTRGATQFHTGY